MNQIYEVIFGYIYSIDLISKFYFFRKLFITKITLDWYLCFKFYFFRKLFITKITLASGTTSMCEFQAHFFKKSAPHTSHLNGFRMVAH